MQIAIISTVLAIVLFFISFFGFREGLRLGMNVSKGKDIEPLKTPIKAIQEHKVTKKPRKQTRNFRTN